MSKQLIALIAAVFAVTTVAAQLEPTRLKNVFIIDTKGGSLEIINDSTQLIFKDGSVQILHNYKTVATISDNSIKEGLTNIIYYTPIPLVSF